jgi:hypothetical protein
MIPKSSQPTLHDKIQMLDYFCANGSDQTKTAMYFRDHGFPTLSQSTISRYVADATRLRSLAKTPTKLSTIRIRSTHQPLFDKALSMWVDTMEERQFNGTSGDIIRAVALRVYDKLETPQDQRLKLSAGWLDRFKARNALRFRRFHGEAAAVSSETVAAERGRLQALLTEAFDNGYSINDIYNFDESSFFYAATPDRAC